MAKEEVSQNLDPRANHGSLFSDLLNAELSGAIRGGVDVCRVGIGGLFRCGLRLAWREAARFVEAGPAATQGACTRAALPNTSLRRCS